MAGRVHSWSSSSSPGLITNPVSRATAALDPHAPFQTRIAMASKLAAMQTERMKMVGGVLTWRSSSSPGLIPNPVSHAISAAAFEPEAPSPRRRTIPIASKLAKAQSSIHWELFKSWMSKNNKHYGTDEKMLNCFGIFVDNVKYAEKRNKQIERYMIGLNRFSDKLKYIEEMQWKIRRRFRLMFLNDFSYDDPYTNKPKPKVSDFNSEQLGEAQCSRHWEAFESWTSKYNRKYKSDQEVLYRFEIFVNNLKYMEEMNKRISRRKRDTQDMHRFSDINPEMIRKVEHSL